MGYKYLCYDGVTQGSMLYPLPLSNYPYVGRLGLRGGVSVATQGASVCSEPVTGYLRISALIKNVVNWCWQCELLDFSRGHSLQSNHKHKGIWSTPDWKIYFIIQKKKMSTDIFSSVCLDGFCWGVIKNICADGDLMQNPSAHRREGRPGCQSGSADKTCRCGWPAAKGG